MLTISLLVVQTAKNDSFEKAIQLNQINWLGIKLLWLAYLMPQ